MICLRVGQLLMIDDIRRSANDMPARETLGVNLGFNYYMCPLRSGNASVAESYYIVTIRII